MDVTKTTFAGLLPEIKTAIDNATFLSIDCELTGLNTGFDINAYDTPKQYFEKMLKSSKEFLIIQFGLCTFRYDKHAHKFKHKTYNFYIFPTRLNRMVPDHRFLCQASSIDFLISQGFDFNKLFKEGISFLNNQSEHKYQQVLDEGRVARAKLYLSPQSLNAISVPEEDKPFIDSVFAEIEEFIAGGDEERVLPKCNPFLRRLIYQTASGRLNNRASLQTRQVENNERVLVVTRPKSVDDRKRDEEAKVIEETETLKKAIGFSELMQYISESRKLLVGHNMFLDLCHSIDKFLTNIPADYESFKECAHCLFPSVLDTKYMSSFGPFKDLIQSTVLSKLLASLSESPFGLPAIEAEDDATSYSLNDPKEHEAGYDAFITGICFISMWKYLGETKKTQSPFDNFNLIKPYVNRLFLMRIQDSPYIQLDGKDPNPSRDHVFHLSFPKDWKLNDIVQLFSPFGNVFVAWIDDTSAYIALHRRDQAKVALSTLSQSDTYKIMTYAQRNSLSIAKQTAEDTKRTAKTLKQTARDLKQSTHANETDWKQVKKKRNDSLPPVKKRKTSSSISQESYKVKEKSIRLDEDQESSQESDDKQVSDEKASDLSVPCLIKPRKRTISKTFAEDNCWD